MNALGKTTNYKNTYDYHLLERIERNERRKNFKHIMYGVDIWNCYEVSCLDLYGKPIFTQLKIINPADTKFIWESKSLKLYLYSLNNTKFKSIDDLKQTIKKDLSNLVESSSIGVYDYKNNFNFEYGICLDTNHIQTEVYEPTINILSYTLRCMYEKEFSYYSDLLRTNCEITNQPDWARIFISYIGKKIIDRESLLKYIISYRNHQMFHEPTCEKIYQDLYDFLEPSSLKVLCQYTRRGGIDINPYRSTFNDLEDENLPKLIQQ